MKEAIDLQNKVIDDIYLMKDGHIEIYLQCSEEQAISNKKLLEPITKEINDIDEDGSSVVLTNGNVISLEIVDWR